LLDEVAVLEELEIKKAKDDGYDPETKDPRKDEETTSSAIRGVAMNFSKTLLRTYGGAPKWGAPP